MYVASYVLSVVYCVYVASYVLSVVYCVYVASYVLSVVYMLYVAHHISDVVCVHPKDQERGCVLRGMPYGVWCMLLYVAFYCMMIYVAVCYVLFHVVCAPRGSGAGVCAARYGAYCLVYVVIFCIL